MTAHRRRAARSNEDGSVAIAATAVIVLLSTVVLLVLRTGHANAVERELQSAADAAAIVLASELRENGLPDGAPEDGQLPVSQTLTHLVASHTRLSFTLQARLLDPETVNDLTYAVVEAVVTAQYNAPFGGGSRSLTFASRARVLQHVVMGARRWPAAVLLLDRSTSMDQPVQRQATRSDGTRLTRWDLLREIVNQFAAQPFPVRLGMLTYHRHPDTGAQRVMPPADNVFNGGRIRSALQGLEVDRGFHGTWEFWNWESASTNFKEAFEAAGELLRGDPSNRRHVLIISDGAPTSGGSMFTTPQTAGIEAAGLLRQAGVAVHSVNLSSSRYLAGPNSVMGRLSGPAQATNPDQEFAHVVDIDHLDDTYRFLAILAESFCTFPVMHVNDQNAQPLAGDRQRIFVFMDNGSGDEQPVPMMSDLTTPENRDRLGFRYLEASSELRLTMETCRQLGSDASRRLIIRWGRITLRRSPAASGNAR